MYRVKVPTAGVPQAIRSNSAWAYCCRSCVPYFIVSDGWCGCWMLRAACESWQGRFAPGFIAQNVLTSRLQFVIACWSSLERLPEPVLSVPVRWKFSPLDILIPFWGAYQITAFCESILDTADQLTDFHERSYEHLIEGHPQFRECSLSTVSNK
jgi:hypothetical protein